MMKVAVIGDEDTVTGFRLAGVKKAYIYSEDADIDYSKFEDVGLIIVNEKYGDIIRQKLGYDVIIVEIPDKTGRKYNKNSLASQLAMKAVGVKIGNKGDLNDS